MSTLLNLCKAFAGESQARNRYTLFANAAKKEGLDIIAALFTETANQEAVHARLVYEMIQSIKPKDQPTPVIESEVPIGFGSTAENLMASIAGETYETEVMYPEFAKIAKEEGHTKISAQLTLIVNCERNHCDNFKTVLEQLKANTLYKKDVKVFWICRECGYIVESEHPPKVCPLCLKPGDYFRIKVKI
ncbi:Rubrerythrin [Entamoeba marina]